MSLLPRNWRTLLLYMTREQIIDEYDLNEEEAKELYKPKPKLPKLKTVFKQKGWK